MIWRSDPWQLLYLLHNTGYATGVARSHNRWNVNGKIACTACCVDLLHAAATRIYDQDPATNSDNQSPVICKSKCDVPAHRQLRTALHGTDLYLA